MKKAVLRNFINFLGKHLCQSLLFNKVAGLRTVSLLKKRLWDRCFLVNFAKFLRTTFLRNPSGRLLPFLALSALHKRKWMTLLRIGSLISFYGMFCLLFFIYL